MLFLDGRSPLVMLKSCRILALRLMRHGRSGRLMLHDRSAAAIGASSELAILRIVSRASITSAARGQMDVDVLGHVSSQVQKQPEPAAKWW